MVETGEETARKLKAAQGLFDAAVRLLTELGDPADPKNAPVADAVIRLENAVWQYAA